MFIPVEACWFIAGALSMLVALLLAAGVSAWHQRKKAEGEFINAVEAKMSSENRQQEE